MSLFSEALKQSKENRRKEEQLKRTALQQAKLAMTAEARISALLDNIAKLFEDTSVKEATFEIEDTSLSVVSTAIFEGKFAEYSVALNGNILIVTPQIITL